ncbi:MAG: hypothetical protein HKN28_09405 [Alphaproteobacteria bacterium]|nr:hypothetical protein [Alphaproteobacteria bacterium]
MPALADAVKILPVDQASQDPKFLAVRDKLLAAVRRRDVEAVVAVAAEDIKLSFGGDYGRDQFRQRLATDDNGEGGSYWAELEWALKLGGVFNGDHGRQFCTPYVSCTGSHQCGDCDPFETLVAVSDRAPVYATADSESAILTHLSYDVVTLVDYGSPRQRIRLADGRIGYVAFPDFRSPIGYRAYFEKREGRWQMRIFIAGD